jgi:RNA polymerase sigma factor (sigma-70 family)
MNPVAATEASATEAASAESWRRRSAQLFEELRRPAAGMLRRAFGRAFGDDEIEDIYSSAWLGTLRALQRRQAELTDEEIRKYVLTAVAHQASKELRRRRRRPTSPLDDAPEVADPVSASPEERAASAEDQSLARELLVTLPPRRRAVMMLRYGWGLEPSQVCGLVKGLSPRAYRKEITRGIDDLTVRLRMVEEGEWCADREPLLKAYAAGLANDEQHRQATHHLANCRDCSEFVGRLAGHLHDLGSAAVLPLAVGGVGSGVHDRLSAVVDRLRGAPGGGRETVDAGGLATQAGAARGGGTAGAGLLAKLGSLGAGGKLAASCLAGGAAAATCVAVGVGPLSAPDLGIGSAHASRPTAHVAKQGHGPAPVTLVRPVDVLPARIDTAAPPQPVHRENHPAQPAKAAPSSPVAPTAAPAEVEFGVAAAAAPTTSGSSGATSSTSPESSPVGSEFGP